MAECKDKMVKFEDETERKKTLKNELDTELNEIVTIQNEIGKILESYCGKFSDFENRKNKSEKYSKKWTPVIEAAIKNQKADLDKKIKEYDDKITLVEKEIPLLEKAITEAINQNGTSGIKCDEEEEAYEKKRKFIVDFFKDKGKIENKLENLETLEAEIDTAYKNDKPMMYALISEYNKILKEMTIKRAEEIESDFYDSWKKLNNAKKDKKEKEEELEIARVKLADKKEELEQLKEKRKDSIIINISDDWPQGNAGKPAETPKKEDPK
jgi:chromosome segregation ATPase